MKTRDMQKNFIEKLLSLKKLLESRFSVKILQDLDKTMSRLAHYHYHKRSGFLVGLDREVYNFLIDNSYNPFTVYRWLLLERLPDDIKFQIRNKELTQKDGFKRGFERKHETIKGLSDTIRVLGLNLIRRM